MDDSDTSEEFHQSWKTKGNGKIPAKLGGGSDSKQLTPNETYLYIHGEFSDEVHRLYSAQQKEANSRKTLQGMVDQARIDLNNHVVAVSKQIAFVRNIGIGAFACFLGVFADRLFVGGDEYRKISALEEEQKKASASINAVVGVDAEWEHFRELVRKDLISTSNLTHQAAQQIETFAKEKRRDDGLKVVDGYKENENLSTLRAAYHQATEELKFLRWEVKQLRGEVEEFRDQKNQKPQENP